MLTWNGDWSCLDEVVPACPPIQSRSMLDPRPSQIIAADYQGKVTESYDDKTGEVTYVIGHNPLPSESELKYSASHYRKQPAGMAKLTFLVSNAAEDSIQWLLHHGWERESRDVPANLLAFAKNYSRRHGRHRERD